MKIYVLVGNIASGKTTVAKNLCKAPNTVSVSKDWFRYMLGAGEYLFDPRFERIITQLEYMTLDELLWHKLDVVVDDAKYCSQMERFKLINEYGVEHKMIAVVLPLRGEAESVKARMEDEHGHYGEARWREVYQMFNSMYVKPTKEEGFHEVIELKNIGSNLLARI